MQILTGRGWCKRAAVSTLPGGGGVGGVEGGVEELTVVIVFVAMNPRLEPGPLPSIVFKNFLFKKQ